MRDTVFFDKQLIPAADASIPSVSEAALYGKGIFTTVSVEYERPLLWEKHWKRLRGNAATQGIDISEHTQAAVYEALTVTITKNGLTRGRARITFFDETPGKIWTDGNDRRQATLFIVTADRRVIPDDFKLTFSPHRVNTTSPLAGVKSCNYLEHLMAFEEAGARGFDEAVRVNERGEVASACMSNVFWESRGRLFTPSLKTGCLAGTTRKYLLENAECSEVEATAEALSEADDIYLTSAGIGVVQAAEFNGRRLKNDVSPITKLWPPQV